MGKDRTIGYLEQFMDIEEKKGCFRAFADFVRQHDELELLLRGNSNEVTIYYYNNVVWKLKYSETGAKKTAKVTVNYHHMRYSLPENSKKWMEDLHKDYDFPLLAPAKYIVYEKNAKTGKKESKEKYGIYHAGEEGYVTVSKDVTNGDVFDDTFVAGTFKIIEQYMADYFYFDSKTPNDPRMKDQFREALGAEQCTNKRNYLEKQNQQAYFTATNHLKDGLFVYDLEYKEGFASQEAKELAKKAKGLDKMNKPDCLGIRFDKDKHPSKFVMIEIKSNKEAEEGTSGTKVHLDGMKADLQDPTFVRSRLTEATALMKQYSKLRMRGFTGKEEIPNFEDLLGVDDTEILLVYTDRLAQSKQAGCGMAVSERFGQIPYTIEHFQMTDAYEEKVNE